MHESECKIKITPKQKNVTEMMNDSYAFVWPLQPVLAALCLEYVISFLGIRAEDEKIMF